MTPPVRTQRPRTALRNARQFEASCSPGTHSRRPRWAARPRPSQMLDCVAMPQRFYRAMTPEGDGLPAVGRTARCLGVRPSDVVVGRDGWVDPGTGGMSVAPGSPWSVPNHRRPTGMGRGSTGHNGDRVYAIEEAPLTAERLAVRPDPERPALHAFVEPAVKMLLGDYEAGVAATRHAWEIVWPR